MVYIDESGSPADIELPNSEAGGTDPSIVSPKSQVSQSQLSLDLEGVQKGLNIFFF